jgi:hypothetical protein
MPRFYFHLFNDIECRDEEGAELPNAAVALQRAAVTARKMAAESVKQGHLILDHRIDVTDGYGDRIGTVHFSDVVKIRKSAAAV